MQSLEPVSADELHRSLPKSEPFDPEHNIWSLFDYADERVKHLVWEIKYYKNTRVADHVGQLLAKTITESLPEKIRHAQCFIIPIPQTNRRFKERGFHHTKLIAEAVLQHLPANYVLADHVVAKIRHTQKQSALENRKERLTNLHGAFEVIDAKAIYENNIILIDDVVTTGATFHEMRRVLEDAGSARIFSFAVAH